MKFSYRFPVVRGTQAGREYYIGMVPLNMLERIFPEDDEYVLPEYRAQRKLNEARIPEIKKYIIDNPDSYVFSALAASIDGNFQFISSTFEGGDTGILEVDMGAKILINDGQHRKAANKCLRILINTLLKHQILLQNCMIREMHLLWLPEE